MKPMADASARLRPDLSATALEVDGVAYVDVRDPRTGTSFRFYDFEFALALQLNGQPVSAIVEWAAATYGLELTLSGIGEFSDRLAELGFLLPPEPEPAVVELIADEYVEEERPASRAAGNAPRARAATPLAPPGSTGAGGRAGNPTLPTPTPAPSPSGLSAWTDDVEISVDPQPEQRALVLASPRELVAEPVGTETLMGFAARVPFVPGGSDPSSVSGSSGSGARFNNGETLMGFAALGDEPPAPAPPPRGALERRQPPAPEAVQMASFADEGMRPERGSPSLATGRRPRPHAQGRGLSLTAVMWIVVLIAAAAAVGYYIWSQQQGGGEARRVRVISPRPAAVYRWFEPVGAVVDGEARALSFSLGGTVGEVLPVGTKLAAGDIAARLQGATAREAEVNRHRSRIGFYEQLRDTMKAAGKLSAQRSAEVKLAEKQSLLDEAQAALEELVLRATEPCEIVEVVARAGSGVAAGAPVVRIKSGGLQGEFALPARDAETALRLGFCRVEVVGGAPTASNAVPHHGALGAGCR